MRYFIQILIVILHTPLPSATEWLFYFASLNIVWFATEAAGHFWDLSIIKCTAMSLVCLGGNVPTQGRKDMVDTRNF